MALISVCDKCGGRENVETFTVTGAGRKAGVDLCGEHITLATDLMDLGPDAPAPASPPRKRPSSKGRGARGQGPSKMVSLEEVEAMEKSS